MLRLNSYKVKNGIALAIFILTLWSVMMFWVFSICSENNRNFVERQIKACEASGYAGYIVKNDKVTCLD